MITDQTLFSNTKPTYHWRFNKENISAEIRCQMVGKLLVFGSKKKGGYCTSQLTNRTSQLCHCHPALPFALKSIIHTNEFINKKSSMKTREKGCKQISITVRNLFFCFFLFPTRTLCNSTKHSAKQIQTSSKFYWMPALHIFRRRECSANVKSLKQVVVFVGSPSLYLHLSHSLSVSPSLNRFLSQ